MIEVFIETDPVKYQKQVVALQGSGWRILFINSLQVEGSFQWVITAGREGEQQEKTH